MAMKGCDTIASNRCIGYDECDFCRVNGFCGEMGYCGDDCEFCTDYKVCDRPEKEVI